METSMIDRPDSLDQFPRHHIEQSLVERFLFAAENHPNHTAIETDTFVWTYRQLVEAVDQFAVSIVARCGAGPGRVGLLFPHDAPMCAAMLAVLRAGKTYVPLDPAYPLARLQAIWGDSEPELLLADAACRDQAVSFLGDESAVLVVDASKLDFDVAIATDWPAVTATSAAYILYTSGSTGRPKGVVQSHRNVLHFICEYTRNLQITSADRMTLLSSYSFDASVMAIYGALLNGALLLPRNIKTSGFLSMGAWLDEKAVTIYHSTPTVFRAFLSHQMQATAFPSVRLVVMGGEPVTKSDIDVFNRHFCPGSTLINGLGPTESTVTLQKLIAHGQMQSEGLVPVGMPIRYTEVLLLDDSGSPTEIEGELAFCSEHLAVGYWRRPDEDARAFVPHPLDSARRIYRTGDLARKNPDGSYSFLGRRDLQVKINGVRIELEDIERVLENLEVVRQCVVVADRNANGLPTLVAFVRTGGSEGAVKTLPLRARALLPDAMVPQRFIEVDQFPLTTSNKLDRKALEEMARSSPAAAIATEGFVGLNEFERQLKDIWNEILGAPPRSTDEDFFESGGDSLAALQLVDSLEEATGKRIGFGEVFSRRTFRGIADLGLSAAREGNEGAIVTLAAAPEGCKALFCICGVELYKQLAESLGPAVSTFGIFLPIEEAILRGSAIPPLEHVAQMYLEMVLKHQPVGPFYLCGVSFGGMVAYEMARQLRLRGQVVAYLGIFDTALPQMITLPRRMRAHVAVSLRRGPAQLLSRAWAKVLGEFSQLRGEGPVKSEADEEMALARGDIYSAVLDKYRGTMPNLAGNAFFYRAIQTSEFEEVCYPPDCHWSRFIEGKLTVQRVPGGHISMLERPHVEVLASAMLVDLDSVEPFRTASLVRSFV